MDFELEDPLTSFDEQQIDTLFASESEHIPSPSIIKSKICFRQQAISLILQGQYCCNFNRIVSYVAATYVDRFIAMQEIPDKPWILRLLVLACVSLASKMNESDLSFSDIQRDEGFIFDALTIRRMELLILNALNWRMRLLTPFSFIHYFLSLTNCIDPSLIQTLKSRAVDIIFKAHQETAFLVFNPSLIAATALVYATHTLFPVQYPCFRFAISSCKYVDKEKLSSCYRLMQEKLLLIERYNKSTTTTPSPSPSMSSSTEKTPRSVLDIDNNDIDRFKQLKNRQNNNSESEVTTGKEERDVKRQRLDDFFLTC